MVTGSTDAARRCISLSTVPGTSPEAPLVAALVVSLVPARPSLAPDEREAIVADVARLVASQIAALPTFLRLPYRLALLAFDLLPLLRWGRTFRHLDADTQRAWIRLWDEGGVGPTRSFVKLIRSCTLLAWFDHPRVTAAFGARPA
jgi:hypothetical protein